jgi:hypothetical protein
MLQQQTQAGVKVTSVMNESHSSRLSKRAQISDRPIMKNTHQAAMVIAHPGFHSIKRRRRHRCFEEEIQLHEPWTMVEITNDEEEKEHLEGDCFHLQRFIKDSQRLL